MTPTTHGADERIDRAFSLLWWLTAAWGLALIWLTPRGPLVDLPQHAAQVSLLTELWRGNSPWSDLVWINIWTPYLLGYGLAAVLSLLMPVTVAFQVLLSIAYTGFLWTCSLLRRRVGAPAFADWLALPVFFGFAFQWGFVTFLASAPIGLLLLLSTDTWVTRPSRKQGALVLLLGLLLLASHGLLFAFFWLVCCALCAFKNRPRNWGALLQRLMPMVLLGLACVVYLSIAKANEQKLGTDILAEPLMRQGLTERATRLLYHPFDREYSPWHLVSATAFLIAPWLMGWRPTRRFDALAALPIIAVVGVFALVPSTALSTAFLYQRFGLLFFPAYGLMFSHPPERHQQPIARLMGLLALLSGTWLALMQHSLQTLAFKSEAASFEQVLAAMAPGHRALYLALSPHSEVSEQRFAYLHFGSWYQAEKSGFVDFNFAWYPPQVVRFKPEHAPSFGQRLAMNPRDLNWQTQRGEQYQYVLARTRSDEVLDELLASSPCTFKRVMSLGAWRLHERVSCVNPTPP